MPTTLSRKCINPTQAQSNNFISTVLGSRSNPIFILPPNNPPPRAAVPKHSTTMSGGDGRYPQSADSPGNSSTKRKHEQSYTQVKKQRFVSNTVTSTTRFTNNPQRNWFGSANNFNLNQKNNHRRNTSEFGNVEGQNRKWVYSSRDLSNCKDKFVVVSYNILGVENTLNHPDLYPNIPATYLDWKWRKNAIRKEINNYLPSVLCFQEVDRFDDLNNSLQEDGFRGVYKARTGEARDGCAIFWKDEQFTLLHQENIEFREFDLRDNVAQLCVLRINQKKSNARMDTPLLPSPPTRNVLVGNIHVLFCPKRGDVKIGQIRLFLEKAHKLSEEWGSIPIVLSGDLNSVPKSAMYQFLASSELDLRLHDRKQISGQVEGLYRTFGSQNRFPARRDMDTSMPLMRSWPDEELRLATGNTGVIPLRHNLKLCSAYFGVPGNCRTRDNLGEPLATSYHSKFMGTVDYIWHTQEVVPVRVLETLPLDVLRRTGGLPNEKWGSDHLALVCELAFVEDESESS